jgi:hypothetical protein
VAEHNEFIGLLAGNLAGRVLDLLERAVVAWERSAESHERVAAAQERSATLTAARYTYLSVIEERGEARIVAKHKVEMELLALILEEKKFARPQTEEAERG